MKPLVCALCCTTAFLVPANLCICHASSPRSACRQPPLTWKRRLVLIISSATLAGGVASAWFATDIDCTKNSPGRPCNPVGGVATLNWFTAWMAILSASFYLARAAYPAGAGAHCLRLLWEIVAGGTPVVSLGGWALYGYATQVDLAEDAQRTGVRFFLSPFCLVCHSLNAVAMGIELASPDALPLRPLRLGGASVGSLVISAYLVFEWFIYEPKFHTAHYFMVDLERPRLCLFCVHAIVAGSLAWYHWAQGRQAASSKAD